MCRSFIKKCPMICTSLKSIAELHILAKKQKKHIHCVVIIILWFSFFSSTWWCYDYMIGCVFLNERVNFLEPNISTGNKPFLFCMFTKGRWYCYIENAQAMTCALFNTMFYNKSIAVVAAPLQNSSGMYCRLLRENIWIVWYGRRSCLYKASLVSFVVSVSPIFLFYIYICSDILDTVRYPWTHISYFCCCLSTNIH